jgi:hypothetical protein
MPAHARSAATLNGSHAFLFQLEGYARHRARMDHHLSRVRNALLFPFVL